MRAQVIMPRSPTMTIFRSPNASWTTSSDRGERGRVGGVPLEDADRDRAALGVGEQPVLDLQLAFLAVAGVAAHPERAVRALQPRARQVEHRHPRRVRARRQVPAGELPLDRVLPGLQPVHRRVGLVGRWRPSMPRSGPRVTSSHQAIVDSFEPGCTDAGDDQREREVALTAGGAEQGGQAELAGHREDGGDVPVRHRPRDRDRRTPIPGAGTRTWPFSAASTASTTLVRHPRQVRQGLVADLPAVAVGAAQQPRLVLAALPVLPGVRAPDPGHVHRGRLLHHARSLTALQARMPRRHAGDFLATYAKPPGGSRAWSGTRIVPGDPVTSV